MSKKVTSYQEILTAAKGDSGEALRLAGLLGTAQQTRDGVAGNRPLSELKNIVRELRNAGLPTRVETE